MKYMFAMLPVGLQSGASAADFGAKRTSHFIPTVSLAKYPSTLAV